MNRVWCLSFSLVLLLLVTSAVAAKNPQPEIMGIRLGMTKSEAHARLKKVGKLEKEQRKRQEVWTIDDRRVSHLLIGFDPEFRVRYVTAIARMGAENIRYEEVADLKRAQRTNNQGNYKLTWEANSGEEKYLVIAHGRNPDYLEMYSIKKVE